MAKRDVELVIRAKNEASKAIGSISDALKELARAQGDTGKSAQKTDSLLGQLGQQFAALNKQVAGLTALGNIATNFDRAAQAVQRLESEVAKSVGDSQRLAAESAKAAAEITRLSSAVEASSGALARQRSITAASKKEVETLGAEFRRVQSELNRLSRRDAASVSADSVVSLTVSLVDLKRRLDEATARYVVHDNALKRVTADHRQLEAQQKASVDQQRRLQAGAETVAASLTKQQAALAQSKQTLAEITGIAGQASSALGGVAASQDAVAAASAKAAADLAATKARLDALASNRAGTGSGKEATAGLEVQRRALLEARREWVQAQNEVKRLALAMRETATPTQEMGAALGRAQGAARQAKEEYLRLQTALHQASGTFRGSFAAIDQLALGTRAAIGGQVQLSSQFRRTADALRQTREASGGMGSALVGLDSASRAAGGGFGRLRSELVGLVAGFASVTAAVREFGNIVGAVQSLEAAQSRLGAIFGQDAGRVQQEITFLRSEALRLGVSFKVLADQYSLLAVAADAANFSNEATRKLFVAVAEAARVNKLSLQDTEGVFRALIQIISKGKIQSEELRQQLGDRLPGAVQIMAAALGVTTAELSKMLEQGQVVASQSNLLKFADALNQRYSKQLPAALQSTTTKLGILQATIVDLRLQAAEGGFATELNKALSKVIAVLKSDEGQEFFTGLGTAAGKLIGVLATLADNANAVGTGLGVVVCALAARAIVGAVTSFLSLGGAMDKSRASAAGLAATLAVTRANLELHGVIGAATAGVQALGVALSRVAANFTVARVAAVAWGGVLSALRGIVIGVTASVRALWTAVGGLPGIILTAVTFVLGGLLGDWLGGVNKATDALDRHEQQVEKVRKAYVSARGDLKKWGDSVVGLTKFEALRDVEQARSRLEELRQAVRKIARDPTQADFATRLGLSDLVNDFIQGRIAAEDFRKKLSDLAQANPQLDKTIVAQLLRVASEAANAEDRLKKSEAILRVLNNTATDADRALLGIAKAAGTVNDALNPSAIEQYTAALENLRKHIPELKREMDRLKEIKEIETAFKQAAEAATNPGDLAVAQFFRSEALKRVNEKFDSKEVVEALKKLPIDLEGVMRRIIQHESAGVPDIRTRSKGSDALGLAQFISTTWLEEFARTFPDLAKSLSKDQILELRKDGEITRAVLKTHTLGNIEALVKAGLPVTPANIFLQHFLGRGGGIQMILANDDELAEKIAGAAAAKANPTILGGSKTVGDVKKFALQVMGGGASIDTKGLTASERVNQSIDLRIRKLKEEAQAQDASRRITARQIEEARILREAEADAAREGRTLSEQQRAALIEANKLKHDAIDLAKKETDEKERLREMLREITGLDQQRATLLKEIQQARSQGEGERVAELIQKFGELEQRLGTLIPKARELATTLGDEKVIATLDKVSLRLEQLKVQIVSAQQVNELAADSYVQASNAWSQAIAQAIQGTISWKEALHGLRDAALQFASSFIKSISDILTRASALRFLESIGFGKFVSGGINSLFGHTGAVVGVTGGRHKSVSPLSWLGALRYHGGGVVGLRPDEIPVIAQKNEEIITADDPRHRFNGGGAGGSPIALKVINTFDAAQFLSEALNSTAGEKVLLNAVERNASAFRAATAR